MVSTGYSQQVELALEGRKRAVPAGNTVHLLGCLFSTASANYSRLVSSYPVRKLFIVFLWLKERKGAPVIED